MAIKGSWINSYGSIMTLDQDPATGILTGTYASTTGGTGTYDVVGCSAIGAAIPSAGETMSVSILWRSNDGGKSDPSHEVSAMTGQLVVDTAERLELIHVFVETNPNVPPPGLGVYPDKLVFTPAPARQEVRLAEPETAIAGADLLSGSWFGELDGEVVEISISIPQPNATAIKGVIYYANGTKLPISGFTDIFAGPAGLPWQGVSFCTYADAGGNRNCMGIAGYLDYSTKLLHLTQLIAQSTANKSTWYQTRLSNGLFTHGTMPAG